jgi:hypothetical protein
MYVKKSKIQLADHANYVTSLLKFTVPKYIIFIKAKILLPRAYVIVANFGYPV